jgi:hypothetical protein
MEKNLSLEELATKLYDAKKAEEAAKKSRIEAEDAIAAIVEGPENGSKTVKAGDSLKVTVKRGKSYKADLDAIRNLDIPDILMPVDLTDPVPAGFAFNEKKYELLAEQHPETFAAIAQFVTVTPKKTSVTLALA